MTKSGKVVETGGTDVLVGVLGAVRHDGAVDGGITHGVLKADH